MGTVLLPSGLTLIVWLKAAAPAKASSTAQGEWLNLSGHHPSPPQPASQRQKFHQSCYVFADRHVFGVFTFAILLSEAIGEFYPITVKKEAGGCSRPGGRRVGPGRREASG